MPKPRLETPLQPQGKGCFSSPTVLLQLVLHEFFCSSNTLLAIAALLPELQKPTPSVFDKIRSYLSTLFTQMDDRLLAHPWTPPKGSLSKLHAYAALLSIAMNGYEPAQMLNDEIAKTWQVAKMTSEKMSHPELLKLVQAADRVAHLVPPLLDSFSRDENVIYFLVRHRETLDKLYGYGFVRQLCQKWHPKGVKGIETLLISRYQTRGFNHPVEKIKHLMSDIE